MKKKKKYVYFVVPIIGMLIFAAVFWSYSSTLEAKTAERARILKEQKQKEIDQENLDKKKAYDEAMATQAARVAAKKAREAHDQQEKDDVDAAQQAYTKAASDAERLVKSLERVNGEVRQAKADIAKIKDQEKESLAEEAFLKGFVSKQQANVQQLESVIEKIAAADDANAKAAAAAAAAAKKKES